MWKAIFQKAKSLPPEILEVMLVSTNPYRLVLTEQLNFVGIFLHRDSKLSAIKLENNEKKVLICHIQLDLDSPKLKARYPDIEHSGNSKWMAVGVPSNFLESGVKIKAKLENGLTFLLGVVKLQKVEEDIVYLSELLSKMYANRDKEFHGLLGSISQTSLNLISAKLEKLEPALFAEIKRYRYLGFLRPNQFLSNPLVHHLKADKLNVIYCYIPKNACTLFKYFILQNSSHSSICSQILDGGKVHQYSNLLEISDLSELEGNKNFKFVVLRNPFKRILSAYLDKFAKWKNPEYFAKQVIQKVQNKLGFQENIEKSITFSQFVDYLLEEDNSRLDPHWRPQVTFLGNLNYDYYIQFEDLNSSISYLEARFKLQINKKISPHRTKYLVKASDGNFSDSYPEFLRSLDYLPSPQNMYNPELENKIKHRYSDDIKIYESLFGKVTSSLENHHDDKYLKKTNQVIETTFRNKV